MKQIKHHLLPGGLGLRWHLHFLREDEARLGLLEALQDYQRPRLWEGSETIPMQLVGERDLVDDHPHKHHVDGSDFVRIVEPDGNEWAPMLEWSAAGGLGKPIAGPPRFNNGLVRIVSPEMRDIMIGFQLPEHQFFPVEITHEVTGEKRPYYLFQLLGNIRAGRMHAYWPAMRFHFLKPESGEIFQQFEPGSVENFDEALELFRMAKVGLETSLEPLRFVTDYLIYIEEFDLVWGDGRLGISEKLANAITNKFGSTFVSHWHWLPNYMGFDPEKDAPPETKPPIPC
jgi:hypothetical protein